MAVARTSVPFYLLIAFFFFITSISSFSIHIPKHLENLGYDIEFSGDVMSKYMIGILVGSLVLGFAIDILKSKLTAILTMVLGIVAITLLIVTTNSPFIISAAVALFGLISSSIGIVAPALVTSLFGKRDYSQVYSTTSMGLAIASIVALPAYGFIYDATGSYTAVLYILVAMLAINIVCVVVAFASQKKMVEQGLWQAEETVEDPQTGPSTEELVS